MSAPSSSARARAALAGLAHGGPVPLALAHVLGEALLATAVDLGGMVRRWGALLDGPDPIPDDLRPALESLQRRGVPPAAGAAEAGRGLAAHVVPIALLTHEVPANLLSGTVHVAALTHPGPEAAWSAVALNVAMARLLQGYRDVVPDVSEALRVNAAPSPLLDRVRRLPLTRQADLEPASPDAAAALESALWLAAREPLAARGRAWLLEQGAPPGTRAAAGALLGARTGDAGFPEAPDTAALALRLGRLPATP
ncbi:MAG: ADP-ribosylglycohydrolase family protein [Gemmatimonadales bacterium]|jgi:hypothetical protein|nr:ADP-ribosylglycohydrolase family protein [Gemmatimonadales bacterium]